MAAKDWSGQKFYRLTFIRPTDKKKKKSIIWEVLCDCGTLAEVVASDVVGKRANVKSCGCLLKESRILNGKKRRGAIIPPKNFRSSEAKECIRCGEIKPLAAFHRSKKCKDGYRNYCRMCQGDYNKSRYRGKRHLHLKALKNAQLRNSRERNRKFILQYLSTHPCIDCGESRPVVLEFDHVRGKKHRDITYMISHPYSLEVITRELEKCEVRCANCHRIRTATVGRHYRTLTDQELVVPLHLIG